MALSFKYSELGQTDKPFWTRLIKTNLLLLTFEISIISSIGYQLEPLW